MPAICWRRCRDSIPKRIVASVISITVAGVLTLALNEYRQGVRLAEEKNLERLMTSTELLTPYIQAGFAQLEQDLEVLQMTPPIQGIIRARRNGGIDPFDGSSERMWKQRLGSIQSALLRAREGYTQVRFLACDGEGPELVRVNRRDGSIERVPEGALQRKGAEPYFHVGMRLKPGEVHFSEVTINRENGRVEPGAPPTIRAITPVFDDKGKRFGLLVINEDFPSLLTRMLRRARPDWQVVVSDDLGFTYVYDPATGVARSWFAGEGEDTAWYGQIVEEAGRPTPRPIQSEAGQFVVYGQQVDLGHSGIPRWLRIASIADRETLYDEVEFVGRSTVFLAGGLVIATGIIAFVVGSSIVRPIRQMHRVLVDHARTGVLGALPTDRRDEIGEFARSFEAVSRTLRSTLVELQDTSTRLETIIEHSVDGLIVADDAGTILRINPAAEEFFGLRSEDIVGTPVSEWLQFAEASREPVDVPALFHRDGRDISSDLFELVGRCGDGNTLPLEATFSPVSISGRQLLTISLRDVTERRKAQLELSLTMTELALSHRELVDANRRLDAANRDVRSFASIISHDLRAPLINLLGFSAELRQQVEKLHAWVDEEVPQEADREPRDRYEKRIFAAADFISSAATTMEGRLEVILRLARLGRYEFEAEAVNLRSLLEDIVARHVPPAIDAEVEIDVEADRELTIDREAITIILTNLVSNAIKFREPTRPLRLRASLVEEDTGVTLSVEDNGRGIAESDRELVFAMFRRAGRQDTVGEGIGLAYSETLVRRLEGRLWFDSEPCEGSRFHVFLPLHTHAPEKVVA